MPDHWHGLVVLGGMDTLSSLVGRVKGALARAANSADGTFGPVWAAGFHDRALRFEDDLRVTARYVVMNPVRARIVTRIGLYPFWDATWIDVRSREPL